MHRQVQNTANMLCPTLPHSLSLSASLHLYVSTSKDFCIYLSLSLLYSTPPCSISLFLSLCLYSCVLTSAMLYELCRSKLFSSPRCALVIPCSGYPFGRLASLYCPVARLSYQCLAHERTRARIYPSIHPSIYLSIRLFVSLSLHLCFCLSLSIYPSTHLSTYPSICQLSMYLSTYLSIYLRCAMTQRNIGHIPAFDATQCQSDRALCAIKYHLCAACQIHIHIGSTPSQ